MTKPKLIFDATVLNMYIFITVALKMSLGFVTYGVKEVLRENYKESSRPMRDLDFDHVTPF